MAGGEEAVGAARAPVTRFAHGSRVPGWDTAADLEKDPAVVPDPATTPVPELLRAEIEGHMAKYPDHRSAVLPALAAAQREHGWCSPTAIEQVACVMRLTPAYLTSVATFYDMLETHPVGRHSIYVCTNISCSLLGADELYAEVQAAAGQDPEFNVRAFECLGACDIAPMASVDGVYIGPLEPADAGRLVDDVRAGRPPLPDRQLARRAVADTEANTRDWSSAAGEAPVHTAQAGAANPDMAPSDTRFGDPAGPEDSRGGTPAPLEPEAHPPPPGVERGQPPPGGETAPPPSDAD